MRTCLLPASWHLRWWEVVVKVTHWLLLPWLWYGRWESQRVIDWYLNLNGHCYFWDAVLSEDVPRRWWLNG